jgi:hypothetical protein
MPRDGNIDHLFVVHNQPSSTPVIENVTYTLWVNGAATALTVTLASNASVNSDLVHSVPVNQGDLVSIQVTKNVLTHGEMRQIVATVRVKQ